MRRDHYNIQISIPSVTFSLKSNELLWQRTEDGLGTPNHTTVAITHTNKVGTVPKSISKELGSVKNTVTSMVAWKEGVEQQLLENRREMAAVNKKLDLLLEAILPSGFKSDDRTGSAGVGRGAPSDVETDEVSLGAAEERADVITITAAGHGNGCSPSFMSVGQGVEFPDSIMQGMLIQ